MKDKPVVSACMVTYNHARYIAQAVEGVLQQKTLFPVQLIVAEDCSVDGTRTIIENCVQQYPQVTLLSREKNMGMMPNLLDAMNHCTGKYIALCEGDDFWTDPYKLQKQVDFLDKYPDFAICAHNLDIVTEDGKSTNKLVNSETPFDTFTLTELAKDNLLPTASCVYRNNFTAGPSPTGFPVWLSEAKIGDYCLHMLAARFGKIKYMPEVMGAYRVHGAGAWSLKNVIVRNTMLFDTLHLLKQEFQGVVKERLVNQQISNLSEFADHGYALLGFNLPDFFASRKESILELIKDDYSSFIQIHFSQQRATSFAEYKYGKLALKPMRWLIGKISR